MIFGTRDIRNDLGVFSSEKCRECKNSYTYHFYKITRFFVLFFLNLIPLKSHYEAVCENCGDTQIINAKIERSIAKENFKKRHRSLTIKTVLKLAAAVIVVAAAIVLPLTIHIPLDSNPETLKNLVSEDGLYSIQNSDGVVLGVVQITDGVSQITYYDDTSVLVNEPGADGSFIKHEYRQEATNDDTEQADIFLVRIADNPGVLEDRYGTAVRIYHYDTENDALGYSQGVENLSAIEYTSEKVTYPFKYYSSESDEPSDYYLVLYLSGDQQLEATFIPETTSKEINQFVMLTVRDLVNGRVQTETSYNFEETTIALAKKAGITQLSSAQDILSFMEQYAPTPTMITTYEYYKNTKVISSMTLSIQDTDGEMQSISQFFDITVKNGYYIVQSAEEDQ